MEKLEHNRIDTLSASEILKCLGADGCAYDIEAVDAIGSTNAALKERAKAGAAEGSVIIADTQTRGRGRASHKTNEPRTFYSPSGTGLYMSLLLKPRDCPIGDAVRLTTAAAVALCEAIETLSPDIAEIKWVNDVYMRGKKVAGILVETSFSPESGLLCYAVVGVGINVYPPESGFPRELERIAGAVFAEPFEGGRNRLAAAFLSAFTRIYKGGEDYIEGYRARSFLVGRDVKVLSANGARQARVLGVDGECRLLVRYEDGGEIAALSNGEVSLEIGNGSGTA